MKDFIKGLAVLFFLAVHRKELSKALEPPKGPEKPDWTEEQWAVAEDIRNLYFAVYPDQKEDSLFNNERFYSADKSASHHLRMLHGHYEHLIELSGIHKTTAVFKGEFHTQIGGKSSDGDYLGDTPSVEECGRKIEEAKNGIVKLRKLSGKLDLNYAQIIKPDRDKDLHAMFGL